MAKEASHLPGNRNSADQAGIRALADGDLLAAVTDGIATITFNRPDKRNAMTLEMWTALGSILREWSDDPSVRALVLQGAGDKAFVSGSDIKQFEKTRSTPQAQESYDQLTDEVRRSLERFRVPSIARIRGYCVGGGLVLALHADLRVAAASARFGIPAARLGISSEFRIVRKLVSLVGSANAGMLLYTGEQIDAELACKIGLINRVVPDDLLDGQIQAIASSIVANAPLSIASAKLCVQQSLLDADQRDHALLRDMHAKCFASADYLEGRHAFMEKRPPIFRGS